MSIPAPAVLWVAALALLVPGSVGRAQTPATSGQPPLLATAATPPPGAPSPPQFMTGVPLQVGDLPPGTMTVRVIRGSFENNVSNQSITLHVTTQQSVLTAITAADGRAQFVGLPVGASVWAETTLDGRRLSTQTFPLPALGGVRVILAGKAGAGTDRATMEAAVRPVVALAGLGSGALSSVDGQGGARIGLAGLFLGLGLGCAAHPVLARRRRRA